MRVLITGLNGYVAWYLLQNIPQGVEVAGTLRPGVTNTFKFPARSLDLEKDVSSQLSNTPADAVIHTAALSSLAACEQNPRKAMRVNAQATGELARWCARNKARMLYLSTDIVFDGEHAPYAPDDTPSPVNWYGKSKYAGEQHVLRECPEFGTVIRLPLLLGPSPHKKNFTDWFLERARANREIPLFYDEVRTPLPTEEAAGKIWNCLLTGQRGVIHLAGEKSYNRMELGRKLAQEYSVPGAKLKAVSLQSVTVPRPRDVRMKS